MGYAVVMLTFLKRAHEWANRHEVLLILLLFVIVLRIPSLMTPHYYGDEEIYFVMGRAWRSGVPLYEAMFDHKPPLIYILAGLAPSIPLFRGALLVSMLIHTILFWKLAHLFWGNARRGHAIASTALFVALTTLPTFEGLTVNAELLMMLPVTLALLMVWKAPERAFGRYLAAGLIAGIGWLYKIPVAFDVLALGLYLFVYRKPTLATSLRAFITPSFWAFFGGFVTPLALTFVYYYLKGNGPSYLATVLTVNLGYVSSWSTSSYTFNPFKSGLLVRGVLLALYSLGLYLVRHKLDRRILLVLLWTAYSWFGALLSARPYPHYLQEPIVPIALLVPMLFVLRDALSWLALGLLVVAQIVTQQIIHFWGYPLFTPYVWSWQRLTGNLSEDSYRNLFDNARRNYAIAQAIETRREPHDTIYVWGTDPTVYNLTETLPTGGKYIVSFHVHDLKKYDYTIEHLMAAKPRFIVWLPGAGEFPALTSLLDHSYTKILTIEEADIYLRLQ
jgi:hypothetical protein